ncbi:MAG TPA: energy transducer TonB [Thermoanaerobaculia bacterium]
MAKSTRVRLVSLLALLFAMTALAPGRARADVQTDVQEELEKAQKLYSAGNYRAACEAYQRAHELAQGKSSPSLIGLSGCYAQAKDEEKSLAAARLALAVAATPGERTKAATTLVHALLAAHRDQEASDVLQSLRKQGMTEDEIRQEVLSGVLSEGSEEDARRLLRLDPNMPLRIQGELESRLSRPQVLHTVKPETLWEARQHPGFYGTVIVEATIDTQGNVSSVRVLKEQPYGLTESAVKAVKRWRFKPATLDGKPVTVYYVLTVKFQIGI